MTVNKSFAGTAIRSLVKNQVNAFDLLNNLLYITSKALNVKENINEFQAFDIINTLLEDYKDVKMEEFIYIFKQGKKGIYGPHYNKFDIETIVHWINAYFASDEYNYFLEHRHQTPVEKVELEQWQKDEWKKTLDNLTHKKQFNGKLDMWAKTASLAELTTMLYDYEKANYKEGIEIIQKEIDGRG